MKKLGLAHKMLLVVCLPLLALLFFSGRYVYERYRVEQEMSQAQAALGVVREAAQLAHELQKFRGVYRRFQIKVEHEFKIPLRHGAAFQLVQVQAQGVEPGEHPAQGAGLVRQHRHEAGAVRTGVDLQILGDADEPGEVAALILHPGL